MSGSAVSFNRLFNQLQNAQRQVVERHISDVSTRLRARTRSGVPSQPERVLWHKRAKTNPGDSGEGAGFH